MEAFAEIGVTGKVAGTEIAGGKALIELPYIGLKVQPIPNGDVNCNPASGGAQSVQQLLGNGFSAISLTPTVEVVALVDAEDFGSDHNLVALNHTFPVPSECYAFDQSRGSVVPASQVVAAASSTSAGAAVGLFVPGAGDWGGWGWQVGVVLLGIFGGGALVL